MTTYLDIQIGGTSHKFDTAKITKSIGEFNTTGTFEGKIENIGGFNVESFNTGDSIEVYSEKDTDPPTVKIFSGTVEKITYKGANQVGGITITGKDDTARLMNQIVEPEVYNDTETSVIVADIMTKYADGVTATNVNVTPYTVDNIVFNNISVFDALRKLAELSGFYFFVDNDSDLHFVELASASSGETIDNTNSINSTFAETSKQVYNNVFVYGDRVLSGWQNEFTGDGAGSVYTLDYKPHNTEVTVSGVIKRGGVFEMVTTPASGTHYLIDYNDKNVIFVSGTTTGDNIPGSLDPVNIKYDRDTPIIKFGRNSASELNYGKRVKVITDTNIKSPLQAKEVLLQTLAEYSEPRKQGTILINGIINLTPGETIIVNLPNEDIVNKNFKMLEVTYTFNNASLRKDEVLSVKVDKKILDLTDTLKDILQQLKDLQSKDAGTSDVISRLEQDYGEQKFRVKEWIVTVSTIGNAFVLGGAVNGMLGSPQLSSGGEQLVLGSGSSAPPLIISGTEASGGAAFPTPWGTWGAEPIYN